MNVSLDETHVIHVQYLLFSQYLLFKGKIIMVHYVVDKEDTVKLKRTIKALNSTDERESPQEA